MIATTDKLEDGLALLEEIKEKYAGPRRRRRLRSWRRRGRRTWTG